MNVADVLKAQASEAYEQLVASIDGVDRRLAWARLPLRPGEYLHTEGSILSVVAHVAGCKIMYASAAYRGLEVRWRDVVERMEGLWPDWDQAKSWLAEAHEYWMQSWAGESSFERTVKTNWEEDWPNWKIIGCMTQHDAYHAGQIQVLRAALEPTDEPPPREGEIWKEYSHAYSW